LNMGLHIITAVTDPLQIGLLYKKDGGNGNTVTWRHEESHVTLRN
jgi:hypothetical protein